MARSEPKVDDLRRALTDPDGPTASIEDVERIQEAVAGELSGAELEELIDRLHREPGLEEAWSLAVAVRRATTGEIEVGIATSRGRRRWILGLAVAATVVLAIALPSIFMRRDEPVSVMRESPRAMIISGIVDGAELSRDAFELTWEASSLAGGFHVRVLNGDDLQILYEQSGVEEPRLTVPASALADLVPGSTVLWWVEGTTPAGVRVRSATFVQRVR